MKRAECAARRLSFSLLLPQFPEEMEAGRESKGVDLEWAGAMAYLVAWRGTSAASR